MIFIGPAVLHGIDAVKVQENQVCGKTPALRLQDKEIVRADIQMQKPLLVKRGQRQQEIFYQGRRICHGGKFHTLFQKIREDRPLL